MGEEPPKVTTGQKMKPETLQAIRELQKEVHEIAKSKGWHNPPAPVQRVMKDHPGDHPGCDICWMVNKTKQRSPLENQMLAVTEIAEATESVRNGEEPIWFNGDKPEGEAVEIADTIFRLLDHAEKYNLDVAGAMAAKMAYNHTRPELHGGKKY